MAEKPEETHPLMILTDAERELVLRLVLHSGSLKDVAQSYGVSYPTIRAKMDRLIERVKELTAGRPRDPMAGLLADLVDDGQMTAAAARKVLDQHRTALTKTKET